MTVRYDVRTSERFETWLDGLADGRAQRAIASRLDRLAFGHWGDVRPLGGDLVELRFHFGAGLRVYVTERQGRIVVVLAGGDKGSQSRDIKAARKLVKELET